MKGIVMDLKDILNLLFSESKFSIDSKKIIIYGAGERGHRLYNILKKHDIIVDFYSDSNPKKWGTNIDGVPCVGIQEFTLDKDNYCILVSPQNGQGIVIDLKEKGFPNVTSPQVVDLATYFENIRYSKEFKTFFHHGHYYSLYPNIDEIKQEEERVFSNKKVIKDIDFNEELQLDILHKMGGLYKTVPRWEEISIPAGTTNLRYRFGNSSLSPADAIGLHCMLRILKPKRMIEVGSGYTSAVALDTNELYLDNRITLTFIEPYPELLQSLLKKGDKIDLFATGLQEIALDKFKLLEEGDILFIDSTHVSKIGSDVNYLFFEILPILNSGVYIHLHDIFYPFEYPKQWIYGGMIWNELYLLRAFLMNNLNYEIVFFQNMMEKKHMNIFLENWPLDMPVHGGSIWLRKK